MADAIGLRELAEWLTQHPEEAEHFRELAQGLEGEIHALAHEVLDRMSNGIPCELLHIVFLSFLGLGWAAAERRRESSEVAEPAGEPPLAEQGSRGPALSPDDLRKLWER